MTDSDSVNILGFFLFNFDSFCLILFIFTPHYNHQCLKGSVLQELCHFVILRIRCLYYD